MKILLIDQSGSFVDFALRCEAQDHEVRVWMPKEKDGTRLIIGDGLVTKVENWTSWMKWADLILTSDNSKYTDQLESWRNEGYPIFGANKVCTAWELERGTGQDVLAAAGIELIPSIIFSSYDDAIAHLNLNPIRYVSKPTGDVDKALSYVSKGPADMMFMLEHWKRRQKKKVPFLFQEFVPGIEMAIGGWVGRNGFSKYFLENFEFKKLMPGEIGVNTGEMGTVMKYCKAEDSLLARSILLPLEADLIREGYTGYIDVAVIIDKKGRPLPLEFTSRPGWPLFQIQQVLHPEVVEWMKDLIDGKDTFEPSEDIALGVVIAIPDFPYGKLQREVVSGFPIWGITDKNRYFIHPSEVQLGTAPQLESGSLSSAASLTTAGSYVMVVSAREASVSDAREAAYARVKEIEISNSPMYRIDIGCRLEAQLPILQALGYATSWQW